MEWRVEPSVVPSHSNRWEVASSIEVVVDHFRVGSDLFVHLPARSPFDPRRMAEVEGPDGGIHIVAADIAEPTGSEVPEVAPADGAICRVIGAWLSWPQPQIPLNARWNLHGIGRRPLQLWIPS